MLQFLLMYLGVRYWTTQRDRVTLRVIEYLSHSMSLMVIGNDTLHWDMCNYYYYYSIETMSVSCTLSEIFIIK